MVSVRGDASQSLRLLSDAAASGAAPRPRDLADVQRAQRHRAAMSLANGVKIATIESSQAAHKTLAHGDDGDDVKALHADLVEAGYMTAQQAAAAGDRFGPDTDTALRALQHEHGLRIHGTADWHTRRVLTRVIHAPLTRGDGGRGVIALQQRLVARGFLTEAQQATGRGVFGPRTEAAVRAAQAMLGLRVTGVADVRTRRALERPFDRA